MLLQTLMSQHWSGFEATRERYQFQRARVYLHVLHMHITVINYITFYIQF